MLKLTIISLIALTTVYGQQQPQYSPQNYANQPSSFGNQQSLTTPAPIHPAAQVHYVNIGQDLSGDYKFGYDTGKGPNGQSFREESRLPDGTVKGAYGYVDANGEQRIVRYTAGKAGFMIDSDNPTGSGSAPKQQNHMAQARATPAAPSYQSYPAPARQAVPQIPAAPAVLPQAQNYGAAPQANPALQYRPTQVPAYSVGQSGQANAAINNPALQYLINSRMINPGLASHATPNAALPQYNAQPQAYAQPQSYQQPAPQAVPQYRPAAPTYQSRPQYTTANAAPATVQGTPLSAFPQLPGVRLVEINPHRQRAAAAGPLSPSANIATNNFQNSFSSNLGGNSLATTTPEPEYTGPVVINAALLSYDIGTQGRRQQ